MSPVQFYNELKAKYPDVIKGKKELKKITIRNTEIVLIHVGLMEQISFKRFKDCLISLTKQLKINLSEIFFEICGEHKKYITFPRLVKGYLAFKKNDAKYSVDFKNFFSF